MGRGAMDFVTGRAPLLMIGSVILGLAVPPLAEALRPFVVPVSIAMAMVSMLRVEPARLHATLRRPGFVGAGVLFVLVALPMAVALVAAAAGAPVWLATGLAYAAAAPPLSSAAAFAILVRIDPALVTGIALPATLLAPFTVWLVTETAPGLGSGVDILALVLRLVAIILGAFGFALLMRRLLGESRVRALARPLDAATVVLVMLIGFGVMHEIGLALRSSPTEWLMIFVLTWALNLGSLFVGVAVFWALGRDEAFALGLCASVKNMAVMVAAVLGTVDPAIALVIITAQLPIYFGPLVMRPFFARLRNLGVRP